MSLKGYRDSSMFKAFDYCCRWEPTIKRTERWEHSPWTKSYAMTEDELVAYAAFHDNAEMVEALKVSGFGNVILDALIRVEMTELFETASQLISVDTDKSMIKDLKITDEDVTILQDFLKGENLDSEVEESERAAARRKSRAQEAAILEGIGMIDKVAKEKAEADELAAKSELVTWERVFRMIYVRLEHNERKMSPTATKAEIHKKLEREKSLLAAKTLIYTRLLPIHSLCKRKLRGAQTTGEPCSKCAHRHNTLLRTTGALLSQKAAAAASSRTACAPLFSHHVRGQR